MEKMKKMKKAAGELAQLAKIGEVMWFGAGCLMVLAALNVCLFEPNILSGEPVKLSLGSVKVDIWGADFLPPGLSKVNLLIRALMFCVLCFLVIYAAKIARKILLPMKEGLPFDESVYKNFRKLGVFTLIGGGMISSGRVLIDTMSYRAYEVQNLFIRDMIIECRLEPQVHLEFILIAFVFFLMSYIFRYGAELQKQSDETL